MWVLVGLASRHFEPLPAFVLGRRHANGSPICRALMLDPKVWCWSEPVFGVGPVDPKARTELCWLICKETSAAGLSVHSRTTHVVASVADEVIVMYWAVAVERGSREDVFARVFSCIPRRFCRRRRRAGPAARKERIKAAGRIAIALSHSRTGAPLRHVLEGAG